MGRSFWMFINLELFSFLIGWMSIQAERFSTTSPKLQVQVLNLRTPKLGALNVSDVPKYLNVKIPIKTPILRLPNSECLLNAQFESLEYTWTLDRSSIISHDRCAFRKANEALGSRSFVNQKNNVRYPSPGQTGTF